METTFEAITETMDRLRELVMTAVAAEDDTDRFYAIVDLNDIFNDIRDNLVRIPRLEEESEKYKNWWIEERKLLREAGLLKD